MTKHFIVLILLHIFLASQRINAQANSPYLGQSTKIVSEERFHDLFLTAGYSTAFGAALGAAFIGLTNNPGKNMHFLAMGASLGFITGSVLGTYVMFAPAFVSNRDDVREYNLQSYQAPSTKPRILFSPTIDSHTRINGLVASLTIFKY